MKRVKEVFITVVIFLLLFSAMAYGITWSTKKRLTNNTAASFNPDIALDGSNIYMVWTDHRWGNYEIYFKKSVDGGDTWSTKKRLTNNEGDSHSPAIALDGSNIYVVWWDDTPGNAEIYFKKSVDGGDTWTTDERLTNNAGDSLFPAIAVDGSNVYVVWADWIPGDNEIYFKRSDDGGATWTTGKRITHSTGISYSPAMTVDGSNIYVVWRDLTPMNYEIYFERSVDGGDTWTTGKRITHSTGFSYSPAIAVDGSNIYVAWYDDTPGNDEIYFKNSDDGGITWTAGKRLTTNTGHSDNPAIAVDGSNIYVVWSDDTPGNAEIYLKKGLRP